MGKDIFQVLSVFSKFNACNKDCMLGTELYLSVILSPPRGKIKGLRGVRFSCHVSDLKYISLIFWWMLVGNCWLITKAILRKIRLITGFGQSQPEHIAAGEKEEGAWAPGRQVQMVTNPECGLQAEVSHQFLIFCSLGPVQICARGFGGCRCAAANERGPLCHHRVFVHLRLSPCSQAFKDE